MFRSDLADVIVSGGKRKVVVRIRPKGNALWDLEDVNGELRIIIIRREEV